MTINRSTLEAAIQASGGAKQPDDQIDGLLAKLRGGDSPERWHLKVQVRLFLDHALNPRRHDVADVIAAARAIGEPNPYVIEVSCSPSIPGYARWVLEPFVVAAGGRVVWLPT